MKATVHAHMQRDVEAGRKWICTCEPCRTMRSLTGVDKVLDVRPLIREIQRVEERLNGLSEGPEMRALLQEYLLLHDKLADVMAR